MPLARHSKKVVSKRKSKSLKGGSKTVSVLVGTKNKVNKSKRKIKGRRQSKRAKVYRLNKKDVKAIMNTIWSNHFEKQIIKREINAEKAVKTLEKFHPLLVNFEVMTTKPKLQGALGRIDLSKKDGVYHFCLNELESYFKHGENESELELLKKYQKKPSPMKGGGYTFDFAATSRIADMPPVIFQQ